MSFDPSNPGPISAGEPRRIPGRGRRQVMDWSLVLASQNIEATIVRDEGWAVMVPEFEFERARQALQLYQKENQNWNWRQSLPGTGLLFHWGALAPCVLLAAFHFLAENSLPALKIEGVVDSRQIANGQWWRLFTAIFLHGDLAHLIANLTTGFVLFGMAMARRGAGVALLAAFLAGAVGNVAGIWLYPGEHRSLGASGMIMGALGLLGVEGVSAWRTTRAWHWVRRGFGAALLVLVLMGFSEGTDIVAHVGGFVGGVMLGAVLHFCPERWWTHRANAIALGILTAFSVLVWFLALRR